MEILLKKRRGSQEKDICECQRERRGGKDLIKDYKLAFKVTYLARMYVVDSMNFKQTEDSPKHKTDPLFSAL